MDIIKHYQFIATLQLRTPLAILERHGETHPGPPDALPRIASQQDGIWIPATKSWAELAGPNADPAVVRRLNQPTPISTDRLRERLKQMGMSAKQLSKVTAASIDSMASDIGPIPKDGGDYLPFLKAFRAIIESSETAEHKRSAIKALLSERRFREYAATHKRRLASWPL